MCEAYCLVISVPWIAGLFEYYIHAGQPLLHPEEKKCCSIVLRGKILKEQTNSGAERIFAATACTTCGIQNARFNLKRNVSVKKDIFFIQR